MMNQWEYLEMGLVLSCLAASAACFARLFIHTLKTDALAKKFRARLAVVDPEACGNLFTKWGIKDFRLNEAFSIGQYVLEKGKDADPELAELAGRINAPFKYGRLTLALVPGGFVAAVVILLVFDAFLKNLHGP